MSPLPPPLLGNIAKGGEGNWREGFEIGNLDHAKDASANLDRIPQPRGT